jgi:hypothetical protein
VAMSTRIRTLLIVVPLLTGVWPVTGWVRRAAADVFQLESGGQIAGEWVNRDEQPRRQYLVKTAAGVTLALRIDQVRGTERQSPAELEYLQKAPLTADTAQGQWALAEWCREQGLQQQRRAHLERVIALDPNHQRARALLGYAFINGQWTTRDAVRQAEGYEYYRNRWRTPQEIEIRETRAQWEAAQRDWRARLIRWRRDLNDPAKARTARENLAAIKEPAAVAPLGEHFAREPLRPVKLLYADILASIRTDEAVGVLVERTLSDPDEEVYHYCLDKLVQLDLPHASDPFIKNLKHANNMRVNRAARALGRLGDRTAISPLIDALITTHPVAVPSRPGVAADATTTTFGDDGSFMKQGEGDKLLIVHVHNQAALDALQRLSRVSFGFDKKAWRYWHAQEKLARDAAPLPIDARRQ